MGTRWARPLGLQTPQSMGRGTLPLQCGGGSRAGALLPGLRVVHAGSWLLVVAQPPT